MEKKYQVIIVGAGPAGTSLGYFLAREGAGVLILEKERFPRYKSCAGGVPAYIDKLLGFGIDEVIEQRIKEIDFTYQSRKKVTLKGSKDVIYTVARERFDALLGQKAKESGAEILTNEKVIDVQVSGNGVKAITNGHKFEGEMLVGADGLSSIVARKSNLIEKRRIATTIQAEVWVGQEILSDYQSRVVVDIGHVPYGAGWIFPKEDHLSVGIGGLRDRLKNPRVYFDEFLKRVVPSFERIEIKPWAIPIWGGLGKLAKGRVLLVGDAASLTNPLSGGGIYAGIWSSSLASKVIGNSLREGKYDLSGYRDLILKEMAPELDAAYTLSKLIYPIPWLSFHFLLKRRFVKKMWLEREKIEGSSVYRKLYKYLKLNLFSH